MTQLSNNMAGAWVVKYNEAQARLDQATKYPAFFKPEYVQQALKDRDNAAKWYRFWSVQ